MRTVSLFKIAEEGQIVTFTTFPARCLLTKDISQFAVLLRYADGVEYLSYQARLGFLIMYAKQYYEYLLEVSNYQSIDLNS